MAKRLKRGFWWRGDKIHTRDPLSGKRVSTGTADPVAAELWRTERERLAASPAYRASQEATVGHWVRRMLAIKKAQRSAGTLHMYTVKLGHVSRLFGAELPLSSVTPNSVDAYIDSRRADGAKANTIARELTCLRQLLRHAKREGQYAEDISNVMPIGFSAEYEPVDRVLAWEDLPKLFAGLRNDDERAWVCMALVFAGDEADIHRMRPEDYDPERRLFHVRGTKNRARDAWLPVLPQFQALFDFGYARLPLRWQRASHGVPDACARAEVPHVSPKDLRRTTITWMAENGVAQEMASRFARHVGDQMVRKIYAKVRPRVLGTLIETQLGTNASQRITGPLAEQADAGDLKGHRRLFSRGRKYWGGRKAAARTATPSHDVTQSDAQASTFASQHWALAYAAKAVGL